MGYEAAHHGEGRWNGVAILSRVGLDDVEFRLRRRTCRSTARLMTATCGGIRDRTVYVPNGRSLDDDHYQYKLRWLDRLVAHLDAVAAPGTDVIVAGDLNIAPADADVYDPSKFIGTTHARAGSGPRSAPRSTGGSRTCSGPAPRRRRCSRGGTTERATSTRAAGCASTSCSPRRRSRARRVGHHRPQRPQGQEPERPCADRARSGRRLLSLCPVRRTFGKSFSAAVKCTSTIKSAAGR